jgi:hypothetical protein
LVEARLFLPRGIVRDPHFLLFARPALPIDFEVPLPLFHLRKNDRAALPPLIRKAALALCVNRDRAKSTVLEHLRFGGVSLPLRLRHQTILCELAVADCAGARGHDFGVHGFHFVEIFIGLCLRDLECNLAFVHLALSGLDFELGLLRRFGLKKAGACIGDRLHCCLFPRIVVLVDRHLLGRCEVN